MFIFNAQCFVYKAVRHTGKIDNSTVGNRSIRINLLTAVSHSKPRSTDFNFLNLTDLIINLNKIIYLKRLIINNNETRKEIFDSILASKSNSNAADTQSCKHPCSADTELFKHKKRRNNNNNNFNQIRNKINCCLFCFGVIIL